MKKLFLFITVLYICAARSQTPVLPLFDNPEYGEVWGAYYKDIDNDFSNFIGTWEYINGATSLKIVIKKKSECPDSQNKMYEDFLIGAYRYIENGVEKVNTLSQMNDSTLGVYSHSIFGNLIIKNTSPPVCNDCGLNERRVNLTMHDPTRENIVGLSGSLVLKRFDAGTIQKIKMNLRQEGNIIYIDGNPPQYNSLSVPWGEYILTKVN